ncbi:MAG: glycosyltransferase family 39 protein [Nitrospirae bacterium]|nr:glycosyltransferase family 39 protein [Nitrospirota bacterium]
MYDFINLYWHRLFDLPIHYFFWLLLFLIVLIIKKIKMIYLITNYFSKLISQYSSGNIVKILLALAMLFAFNAYSNIFPYYNYYESMPLVRHPPLSKILYLFNFIAFGTSPLGPRIMQFAFYILSAVYLYRTILLFNDKETALSGAAIYLFSPILFSFASQAAVASGTIFFITLISFHFLRFFRNEDIRDLVLTAIFIGIGFMYRGEMLIMFIACFAYLALTRVIKWAPGSLIHLKILLLPLVLILPWMKIGTPNPLVWSNLISFKRLAVIALMLHSQVSSIVFFLFLFTFVFILFTRRDDLSRFFGLIFIAYYFLFTLMEYGEYNHRYLMALYPTVAVFLSQHLYHISQRIRWKHAFKVLFSAVILFLIFLSMVPRTGSSLITYKYKDFETQYFPIDKATDWIKKETGYDARILSLYLPHYALYLDKIYPDRAEINQNKFIFSYTEMIRNILFPLKNLGIYCRENNISYIIFPYAPNNDYPNASSLLEELATMKYLHENMGKEFLKVADFSLEDNYIYIYKLKDNSN